MVCHVILWNFKEELKDEEKLFAARKIKAELEALTGVVPGLKELRIMTEPLPGSNADLMLYSVFEQEDALRDYQVHPAHVKAAEYVRSVMGKRACMDFEL